MIKTQYNHYHAISFDFFQRHSSPASLFNFIITSYVRNNSPIQALRIYAYMRETDSDIDTFTVPSILKACSQLSWSLKQGQEIHGFVLKVGLDWDVFVLNALIQMYTECENIESACSIFNRMLERERDVVTWSTMIRGYSRSKSYGKALDLISEMQFLRVKPSAVAMLNMVNLFADLGSPKMARLIHAYVVKNSDTGSVGVPITTALLDMYAKCGNIALARRLFNRLNQKTVVSWSAMIAGYIRCNKLEDGVELFRKMQDENILPNEITLLSIVLECGFVGALKLGKQVHAYMIRNGFKVSFTLATSLVVMYGKCGDIKTARKIFDRTSKSERDVAVWTTIISGYAALNFLDQAFELLRQMRNAGIYPNEITMVNLLSLCAETGALHLGKSIHAYIDKQGILSDVILTTTLVDMYAKCGDIDSACRIFSGASTRDICMWNAMIGGLAMHGLGVEAMDLFSQLQRTGMKPNDITFIGALHACSHAGLLSEGQRLFDRMVDEFGMNPKVEHYGCMVDLLGRAGKLNQALEMINRMPIDPNTVVWGSLLAACKQHKNLQLGEIAAKRLLEMDPNNCGYNVLMSNIYAAANRWNDVAGVRKTMKATGIKKAPGFSSMEVNGYIHEFIMGDQSHPQTKEILEKLVEMGKKLKLAGHVPNTSAVLLNVDEEEKETSLTYHSEKLAMAFGLISTASNTPIRIVKNLRVCDDCHSATKLLSKIYKRMIVVRDRNRFHHFSEGSCSCGDYW
ncbi:hypothetical protein MKX03_009692 [Papaver bracteatum]|nr:hypothetical protein MKX03_009692 [Papaver bracteatum]